VSRRLAIGALLAGSAWTAGADAQLARAAPDAIAVGDWQLAPVAEVRVRGEFRRDVDALNKGLLVERARLGADVRRGAIEARVVLQDARSLDVATRSADPVAGPAPVAVTGAYEAWIEAHTASATPSFVRVGRQPVTWGEGRLLGAADWSPTGRSLDAVRGRLAVGDAAFEVLAVALTDPSTSASLQNYGELFGARGQVALLPLFAIDGYVLARIAQENPSTNLQGSVEGETYTGAARLHGDANAWAWGVEGAYQLGRATALAADRAAWATAGHLGHTFARVGLVPTARVGFAYATGSDGGPTYRAFDPFLPDVHTWHGAMDLFAWSNEAEGNARVAVIPWTDAVAAVEYRYARLVEPGGAWRSGYLSTIGSVAGNTKGDLGHEVDTMLRWLPWASLQVEAGYSALILGDGARAILWEKLVSQPSVSHFAYVEARLEVP
jgi:hypothetical protein